MHVKINVGQVKTAKSLKVFSIRSHLEMLPPIYTFIFGCKVDGQWFFHFFENGTKLKTLSEIQRSYFPFFS